MVRFSPGIIIGCKFFFINGFRIGKENFIFILFCPFVISLSFINTTFGRRTVAIDT